MSNKIEIVDEHATMITEVIGDDHFDIVATSSFRDELAFESIQFIALAELIQERWTSVDFVSWISMKDVPQLLELRVGDVADYIVAHQ